MDNGQNGEDERIADTSMVVDAYVGQRFLERRQSLKVSVNALAEAVGLSPMRVRRYERGLAPIPIGDAYMISIALCVDLAELFPDMDMDVLDALRRLFSDKPYLRQVRDEFGIPYDHIWEWQPSKTRELFKKWRSLRNPIYRKLVEQLIHIFGGSDYAFRDAAGPHVHDPADVTQRTFIGSVIMEPIQPTPPADANRDHPDEGPERF